MFINCVTFIILFKSFFCQIYDYLDHHMKMKEFHWDEVTKHACGIIRAQLQLKFMNLNFCLLGKLVANVWLVGYSRNLDSYFHYWSVWQRWFTSCRHHLCIPLVLCLLALRSHRGNWNRLNFFSGFHIQQCSLSRSALINTFKSFLFWISLGRTNSTNYFLIQVN